jgi:uncharacterized protein YdaT
MFWTKYNYPNSMRKLPPAVRLRAIHIGNWLHRYGIPHGKATAMAIEHAKEWAKENNIPFKYLDKENPKKIDQHSEDRFVIPYEGEWAIKVRGMKRVEYIFHSKKEAVDRARMEAKRAKSVLIILSRNGDIETTISYNVDQAHVRQMKMRDQKIVNSYPGTRKGPRKSTRFS